MEPWCRVAALRKQVRAGRSFSRDEFAIAVAALKSEALLNEPAGAGYIDRNRPPALRKSGAWPLAGAP